eukprot:457122-Pyramimonas_sp.AAC.2
MADSGFATGAPSESSPTPPALAAMSCIIATSPVAACSLRLSSTGGYRSPKPWYSLKLTNSSMHCTPHTPSQRSPQRGRGK